MRVCSQCGSENVDSASFCENCGFRMEEEKPPVQEAVLLKQGVKMSFFDGEPGLGISNGNGEISVYSDRVEFKMTFGNALMSMFGGSGKAKGKKDPPDVYRFQDMKEVRTGTYGAGYHTLVLEMKSGKVVSFVPVLPGGHVAEDLRSLMAPYIS